MTVCALVAITMIGAALAEVRNLKADGASDAVIASANARFMSFVWIWGALSLLVTYNFALSWREWPPFFLAFVAAAGVCLFFAATLKEDDKRGTYDGTMKKLGRYLTLAQVIGMGITMAGLLIDGKMTRFLNPRHTDWAANNIFFFGGLALFVIGLNALKSMSETRQEPAH